MSFRAIIHKADEGGYWAEVPALPGCVTQGERILEIEENLRDVIDLWLGAAPDIILESKNDKVMELAF